MSQTLQSVRGMHDLLPEQTPLWQWLEAQLADHMRRYGYAEIRTPVVEKTELFKRSIGDVTDIVEKEMYTFEDRNGESLSLRPEGTAGCVRAGIQHGLLHNQVQRLWYMGPMYRHERPQKGRYREFRQFGVEVFGLPGPHIEAELILLCRRLWRALGLEGQVRLEINCLGQAEERARYRDALVAYFEAHRDALDEDSRRRLERNPLRILDSKNPAMRPLIAGAPRLEEALGEASRAHFDTLRRLLDAADVPYTVNPHLVRGLDYYNLTVFEWITDALGAQGTVCAGGRYDGLVAQLGGSPTPAVGFAAGLERLVALIEGRAAPPRPPLACVLAPGDEDGAGLRLAEALRDALPAETIVYHGGPASLKSLFKRADRSGARWAVVYAQAEREQGIAGLKPLREAGEQRSVPLARLADVLTQAAKETS